jgi:hypothetical protein
VTPVDVANRKQNAQHASVLLVLARNATTVLALLANVSATTNPHSPTKKSPFQGDFYFTGSCPPLFHG